MQRSASGAGITNGRLTNLSDNLCRLPWGLRVASFCRFLFVLAFLLTLQAVCPDSFAQPQTKVLRLGFILASNSQLGAGAKGFADEIAKRTSGRYRIELYPNAALGGEVEMMKAVQLGTVDLAFITGAPLPNFSPEVGIFNIPFLFRDANHARAVLDGPVGQEYLAKFRAAGVVALAWGENGMRHITNSKKTIASPSDLKGLKLRLPQSDVMIAGFKALGANVRALPFPELYGALQSGEFDGQENPIATIQASKFNEVQSYLSLTAHVYDPAVIVISPDVFDALSEEDRRSFKGAAEFGARISRDAADRAEQQGVAELQKNGMQVLGTVDREAFRRSMAPAEAYFEKVFGKASIDRIRSSN